MRRVAAALTVLIFLSGCASTPAMNTPATPGSPRSGSPEPTESSDVPPAHWQAILADLAERGVPTDEVTVVSSQTVTWTSGALGCPQPGRVYTQALVEGRQVVVSVDGTQYDYRFGRSDHPVLCVGR